MNEHRRRRTSRPEGHRVRKPSRSGHAPATSWALGSSSTAPRAPQPWPLDDRLWDVFRLDEDDSPEYPDEGDFWIEADEEG